MSGIAGPPGVDGRGVVQEGLQGIGGEGEEIVYSRRVAASEVVAGKRLWFLVLGGKVGVRKGVKLPSTSHPCPQGPANVPSTPPPRAGGTGYWPYLRAT